jgi:hypothetical protein
MRRQARREARAVAGGPWLDLQPGVRLFRRGEPSRHGDQVLRGFIQINLLPRPH